MRRAVPADQTRLDLLPARLPRNLPYYLSVDVTTLSWRHEVYSFENGHCIALMCRYELLSILIIFFQGRFWQPKKPENDELVERIELVNLEFLGCLTFTPV